MVATLILFGAFLALGSTQPVKQLPVLKEVPQEVLFRLSQPVLLECVIEGSSQAVKYIWQKDGKPLNLNPHITQKKDEGTLVFESPNNEDEGQYQCFAETEKGIASSPIVSLKKTYLSTPKTTLQSHNPIEGKPLKLDCPIPESYPKPTITWVQQLLTNSGVSNPVFNRRIITSPDGTLWFSNVEKEDFQKNFKYVCLAKTPASDEEVVLAEHVFEDLVQDKGENNGELVPQYLTKDMTVKAGDVTMLYCIYGGTPIAHPDWFKDGKDVNNQPDDRITRYNRSSGKRLLIKETWLEDQGTFTCKLNNEVGKPQEHSLYLTVVSPPKFDKKPERQMIVKEGDDVTIPCQVTAVPAATISWTRNAKSLSSVEASKTTPVNADLVLKKVSKSDSGYYGCKALNQYGDNYAETLLVVA